MGRTYYERVVSFFEILSSYKGDNSPPKKAALTCAVFFGGSGGITPVMLTSCTGCTPLCSALALRRGTTHVSGGSFASFRASCRSHTGRLASFHSAQNPRKISRPILRGFT